MSKRQHKFERYSYSFPAVAAAVAADEKQKINLLV
jgi:hypothetical protein